jgi:hypothetical protein
LAPLSNPFSATSTLIKYKDLNIGETVLLEKEEEDKNQYIEGDEDYGEYFNEDSEDFDEGHDMAEFMDFDFDDSMEYKPNYGQYKRID